MQKPPAKFVIFDLDHTLLTCNISSLFGQYLVRKKICSRFCYFFLVTCYFLHKRHLLSINRLYKISFWAFFQKRPLHIIENAADAFFKENQQKIFRPKIRTLLEQHLKEGAIVWVQSTSPDFLVKRAVKEFSLSAVFATKFSCNNFGLFDQIAYLMDGNEKAKTAKGYAHTHGIGKSEIRVYTDAIVDKPLLFSAGQCVCVHPDKKLRQLAKQYAWQILEE